MRPRGALRARHAPAIISEIRQPAASGRRGDENTGRVCSHVPPNLAAHASHLRHFVLHRRSDRSDDRPGELAVRLTTRTAPSRARRTRQVRRCRSRSPRASLPNATSTTRSCTHARSATDSSPPRSAASRTTPPRRIDKFFRERARTEPRHRQPSRHRRSASDRYLWLFNDAFFDYTGKSTTIEVRCR